jgi:hypothetical protein
MQKAVIMKRTPMM